LRGVTRVYSGATPVHALGPLDLDLAHGEFLSVVGPSGCGKSTLLDVLAGLNPPTVGSVSFEGKPVVAIFFFLISASSSIRSSNSFAISSMRSMISLNFSSLSSASLSAVFPRCLYRPSAIESDDWSTIASQNLGQLIASDALVFAEDRHRRLLQMLEQQNCSFSAGGLHRLLAAGGIGRHALQHLRKLP
jgi:ABC-type oligopeptide transport system ATPase subunit